MLMTELAVRVKVFAVDQLTGEDTVMLPLLGPEPLDPTVEINTLQVPLSCVLRSVFSIWLVAVPVAIVYVSGGVEHPVQVFVVAVAPMTISFGSKRSVPLFPNNASPSTTPLYSSFFPDTSARPPSPPSSPPLILILP